MIRRFGALALCLVLCLGVSATALADLEYIFPESDKRLLTWDEVAQWDYESLGFAFNEIFARRGYVFEPGQKYENYFMSKKWYHPNADADNQKNVYVYCTDIEWANYEMIKAVRNYKRANNNYGGKSIWDNYSTGFDSLQSFEYATFKSGQKLNVYSAPSASSWRGANGKAMVSTNGRIDVGGWENGWLMLMYETNSGSVRVGYADGRSIQGNVTVNGSNFNRRLAFDYTTAKVTNTCTLTDDPARTGSSIATLSAGTTVTYLSTYYNRYAWDYVEAKVNGVTARGFIRAGSLNINQREEALDQIATWKCANCHATMPDVNFYCANCGAARTTNACPNCGNSVPLGDNFCGKCGQKLK